ncbi:MAG: hypothetical protein E7658_01615 [Ruminococcaceae bacterium]|nr:hypothetical protein [Oscillospiraceae bacterium]
MNTTIQVNGGMFDSTSVVETVDGFPRGNKAVDAAFFAQMMRCFYADGIIRPGDGAFAVSPGNGTSLQVSPGCAWILGHMAWLKEAATLPLSPDHTYTVCLRLHPAAGYFTLESVEDDTSLPRRDGEAWDLVLAKVTLAADAGAVTEAMITDTRMDKTLCGPVVGAADSLDNVSYAISSGAVGGLTADDLLPKSGGVMTGILQAANDTTGASAVRNIRYGYTLPDSLAEGEIFLLLADR